MDGARRAIRKNPSQFGEFVKALIKESSEIGRHRTIEELDKISEQLNLDKFAKEIVRAADHKDERVAWTARRWMSKIRSPNPNVIARAMRSRHSQTRSEAARIMAGLGAPALAIIRKDLASSSERRRDGAVAALGWVNDDRSVAPLIAALNDESTMIRNRAAESLGRLGRLAGKVVPELVARWQSIRSVPQALAEFSVRDFEGVRSRLSREHLGKVMRRLPAAAVPAWLTSFEKSPSAEMLEIPPYRVMAAPPESVAPFLRAILSSDERMSDRACAVAPFLRSDTTGALFEAVLSKVSSSGPAVRAADLMGAKMPILQAAAKSDHLEVRMEGQFAVWRRTRKGNPVPLCRKLAKRGYEAAYDRIGDCGRLAIPALPDLVEADTPETVGVIGSIMSRLPAAFWSQRDLSKSQHAKSIRKALSWLKQRQGQDGGWVFGDGLGMTHVGLTGLACLAFAGTGDVHPEAQRAIRYLIARQNKSGSLGPLASKNEQLQHAIATVALCEMQALDPHRDSAIAIQKAVVHIQRTRGIGWGYRPDVNDTHTTAWMVHALVSASLLGFEIQRAPLDGAHQWFDKMTEPNFGKVGYNSQGGDPPRYFYATRESRDATGGQDHSEGPTAASIWARFLMDGHLENSKFIKLGVMRVLDQAPKWDEWQKSIDFSYWRFGALCMTQVKPRLAKVWRKQLATVLLDHQKEDGSWPAKGVWSRLAGPEYATATAVLALQAAMAYPKDFMKMNRRAYSPAAFDYFMQCLKSKDPDKRGAARIFTLAPHEGKTPYERSR